jgi:hypothetical protein
VWKTRKKLVKSGQQVEVICFCKSWFDFTGSHGVIYQKTDFFKCLTLYTRNCTIFYCKIYRFHSLHM